MVSGASFVALLLTILPHLFQGLTDFNTGESTAPLPPIMAIAFAGAFRPLSPMLVGH